MHWKKEWINTFTYIFSSCFLSFWYVQEWAMNSSCICFLLWARLSTGNLSFVTVLIVLDLHLPFFPMLHSSQIINPIKMQYSLIETKLYVISFNICLGGVRPTTAVHYFNLFQRWRPFYVAACFESGKLNSISWLRWKAIQTGKYDLGR